MSSIDLEALSACAKALTRAMEPVAVPDATMISEFLTLLADDGWQITSTKPPQQSLQAFLPSLATPALNPLPLHGLLPDGQATTSGSTAAIDDPIPF